MIDIMPHLQLLAKTTTENFAVNISAQPEDQLKHPTISFLEALGNDLGKKIIVRTEARQADVTGRPDLGIAVKGLLAGFIELKAPGFGANPAKLKGEQNKKQWENFKSIPNLIYTDGNEWALYRTGEQIGKTVVLDGDITKKGAKAVTQENSDALQSLLLNFLSWEPIIPHNPRELAKYLAPLTRFLRQEVELSLENKESALSLLAHEWRDYLFPEADNHQFADAYAQTLTYALLLARINGAADLSPEAASAVLDKGNGLLATTLKILAQKEAREEVSVGYDILVRSLSALDPAEILKRAPDLWLYFYEDFLAAYDKKLRNDYGVYYTPVEVVQSQIRLVSELLKSVFGKKFSFADDGVTFLDPAVGTGTYLVSAIQHALGVVRDYSGPGAVAGRASSLARNMFAFECLVGPYAVAHLRLSQEILSEGGSLPDGRLQVYLADTLESPFTTPPGALDLTHKSLVEERKRARAVKEKQNILVCIGNPPYHRGESEQEKGGWVRYGDKGQGKLEESTKEKPILEDFLEPARVAGRGGDLKNLYNDYVYFWRWALWKLFEHQETGGIVSFITASSYLSGPGFLGMREVMRRTFDELWIINLEGDNLGARKTENVFNIQTPVAIAIGICKGKPHREKPAKVHYTKITGTREDKLGTLAAIENFAALDWQDCTDGWHDRFLPAGTGDFFAWPALTDIFPWQQSGTKVGRSWPISFDQTTLHQRWGKIADSPQSNRKALFVERPSGRKAKDTPDRSLPSPAELKKPILDISSTSKVPSIEKYSYRSFDRMNILADARLIDRPGPSLWYSYSDKQIYLASLISDPLGIGQAAMASAFVPDLNYFSGRGSKDIIPLWRDPSKTQANVTRDFLASLSAELGESIAAEDLFAYCYAILAHPAYVQTFWEELSTPGPRIPITKKSTLWDKAVELGRKLIWLHTYGERFAPKGKTEIPPGKAKCIKAIPDSPSDYPEEFSYVPATKEIHFGKGVFGPVAPEVWDFEVSGLQVVQSWLSYRRKSGAGKRSSSLDEIRPQHWTANMTDEFLELLWVLEHTVALFPELKKLLADIISGPYFLASELPMPSDVEREPPKFVAEPDDEEISQHKLL